MINGSVLRLLVMPAEDRERVPRHASSAELQDAYDSGPLACTPLERDSVAPEGCRDGRSPGTRSLDGAGVGLPGCSPLYAVPLQLTSWDSWSSSCASRTDDVLEEEALFGESKLAVPARGEGVPPCFYPGRQPQ